MTFPTPFGCLKRRNFMQWNYPQLNSKHRNESLCLFAYSGVQHIMYCVFALFCLCSLLPVSLDCPFFIAPSVFSNVYLLTIYLLCLVDVLCNRQSTFLWVPNNWCPLLLDWFLVLYRGDFMLGLTNQNELKLARSCNFTSRYL